MECNGSVLAYTRYNQDQGDVRVIKIILSEWTFYCRALHCKSLNCFFRSMRFGASYNYIYKMSSEAFASFEDENIDTDDLASVIGMEKATKDKSESRYTSSMKQKFISQVSEYKYEYGCIHMCTHAFSALCWEMYLNPISSTKYSYLKLYLYYTWWTQ